VLLTRRTPIEADDTAQTLHDRLAALGAAMIVEAVEGYASGALTPVPQAEEGVTYAAKIDPAEARIDWTRSAREIDRQIRGLSPFPGAWFMAPGDKGPVRVKALLSRVGLGEGAPGEALDDALLIACGEGAVRLLRVQAEGRKPMDADDFLRGTPTPAGARMT
jgi:methionyl-tRNA formyltransferase